MPQQPQQTTVDYSAGLVPTSPPEPVDYSSGLVPKRSGQQLTRAASEGPSTQDFQKANAARPWWKAALGISPNADDFAAAGVTARPAPGQMAPVEQERSLRDAVTDPNESYGAYQPLIGAAKGVLSTGRNLLGVLSPYHIRTIGAPKSPDPLDATNAGQSAGKMIEQGVEFLAPGGVVSDVAKAGDAALAASRLPAFLRPAFRISSRAALEAASAAGVSTAQGGDVKSAAETGALGGAAAQGLSEAAPTIAPWLKRAAGAQYSRFLAPTKETTKTIAAQVVPELLDRGQVATSAAKLAERAGNEAQPVGQQISQEVAKLPGAPYSGPRPQPLSQNAQNVVDRLEQYKQGFQVNGVPVNPQAIQHASDLQDLVRQLGPNVSPQSLNRVRQILDEGVDNANGYDGKTLAEGSAIDAQKEAANAMRAELAKTSPDIAKLNAEYTFWRRVQDVAGQTAKRQTGQQGGWARVAAPLIGAGSGFAAHGTWQEGVVGAAAMTMGNEILRSPLYRTTSAVFKNKLANALAAGDVASVARLATRIGEASASQSAVPAPQPAGPGAKQSTAP